jgi:maltose-binding protein MalE
MDSHKKSISLILIFAMALSLFFAGVASQPVQVEPEMQSLIMPKQTITFWYTDDAMTDYINSAAVSFYEETDIRVVPKMVSGLEYIENIYNASLDSLEAPDAYIVSNDLLEKAYLSGTACEIKDTNVIVTNVNYPEVALHAVSCRDKVVGYPLSFETGVFLYNKTYLEDYVYTNLQNSTEETDNAGEEISVDTAETVENTEEISTDEEMVAELSEEEMDAEIEAILPKSIDEILIFANTYDAPENMEAIFRWDVTDIFYNYFFIGASTDVGGINGDDADYIDIYNENAIKSLEVYQLLNQFFAIDTEEISYEDVLDEFIDGKILFSVVTTDAIEKLELSKEEGTFIYDYGMMEIPMINDEIQSAGMSVTNTVAINGYSENKDAANAFAKYIAFDLADSLYDRTGKVPASKQVVFENENLTAAATEYENSVPVTKMIEASNYWMQLEIVFTKAWSGDDVNLLLKELSEQIMTQVTGEEYTEETIVIQEEEEEYLEYSDD